MQTPLGGDGGDYFSIRVKIKKEGSTVYLWKNPERVPSVTSGVPPVFPPAVFLVWACLLTSCPESLGYIC